MTTVTIIVWAILIATSILFEFFTTDFFACCFAVGGLVALVMAAFGLDLYWQLSFFILMTIIAIIGARPFLKKWLIKKTIPTNLDQYFGKKVSLLADVVDGLSTIKINDVVWTAQCEDATLKKGDVVTIQSTSGNKMVVTRQVTVKE